MSVVEGSGYYIAPCPPETRRLSPEGLGGLIPTFVLGDAELVEIDLHLLDQTVDLGSGALQELRDRRDAAVVLSEQRDELLARGNRRRCSGRRVGKRLLGLAAHRGLRERKLQPLFDEAKPEHLLIRPAHPQLRRHF